MHTTSDSPRIRKKMVYILTNAMHFLLFRLKHRSAEILDGDLLHHVQR